MMLEGGRLQAPIRVRVTFSLPARNGPETERSGAKPQNYMNTSTPCWVGFLQEADLTGEKRFG